MLEKLEAPWLSSDDVGKLAANMSGYIQKFKAWAEDDLLR
jgi:hypothetical protein